MAGRFVRWAPGLFFASGASALIHQLVWTRRLVDVLGASASTFSQVVGAFFVGLALGAFWLARRAPAEGRGSRLAGLAEAMVGVLAIPALVAIPLADVLRPFVGTHLLKSMFVPCLVIPPSVAMGMVLPAALALYSDAERRSHLVGLYAANTFGGVAGILGTVFVLIPSFGLAGTGVVACCLNGLVAVGLIFAGRTGAVLPSGVPSAIAVDREVLPDEAEPRVHGIQVEASWFELCFVGFFSGLLVLSLEVLLQHQFAQVTINSTFSSAFVLAVVLVGLGGATWMVGRPWIVRLGPSGGMMVSLGAAAVVCGLEPWVFHWRMPGLLPLAYTLPPSVYFGHLIGLGLVTLLPVMLVVGMIFPLALKLAATGRQVAALLAWNGFGGWLGSELSERGLGPTLGLWRAVGVCGMVYGFLALWMVLGRRRRCGETSPKTVPSGRRPVWSLGWVVMAILVAFGSARAAWRLPHARMISGDQLVEVAIGREGVVATVTRDTNDWRILFNNTYTLGGSKAAANQERQAHLPLLLHGSPREVGVLGVATGSTLAGVTLHLKIERIEAAELSPLAYQMARRHFDPFNRSAFEDPRVQVVLEDARWLAGERRARFDVVIGDLFLPWRTGEGRLFSRDHFRQVQQSLKPGGLYCQWLPLYQLTRPQFDCIVRTFLEVFPRAFVVRGDFYGDMPILGLVGGRSLEELDWTAIERATTALRERADVTDPLVRHPEGVAMMLLGELPHPGAGPINTLGNNWLEWDAGRNILGMRTPWFVGVPAAEWVRGIHRTWNPRLPERWRAAHDAGQFFLTLDVAVLSESPLVGNFRSQIPDRMPAALLQDLNADWRHWPSRVKPAL